jgi:hypothetical protein
VLWNWGQHGRPVVACSFDGYDFDNDPLLQFSGPLSVFLLASGLADYLFPDHLPWMTPCLSVYCLPIPQPPIVGPLQRWSQ